MTGLNDVTVVVVSYNSAAVIEACLAPLAGAKAVIVVDNASGDESRERVRHVRPDAEIILNAHNPGYGSAVNQGFARVRTPYALLINPDAVLSADAVAAMVATARASANTGLIAPLLYSPKRGLEMEWMGPAETRQSRAEHPPEGDLCTWFATGAVWLCDMAAWRDVGGFDENIFLYGEDFDLCWRYTDKGYAILVAAEAKGGHLVSQASPPSRRIRWRKEWNIVWSHLYLLGKHESRQAATGRAWELVRKHGPKTLFYALVFQPKRFFRDLAVTHAAVSFLLGRVPKRPR